MSALMPPFRSNMHSYQQLATEALDGDPDAAYTLAKQQPCKGFLSWLAKWVPADEMTVDVFDRFSDAYQRMELEKLDFEPEEKN